MLVSGGTKGPGRGTVERFRASGAQVITAAREHWLSELNLNLLATVRLERLLIPPMIERSEGVVVYVMSIQSRSLRCRQRDLLMAGTLVDRSMGGARPNRMV